MFPWLYLLSSLWTLEGDFSICLYIAVLVNVFEGWQYKYFRFAYLISVALTIRVFFPQYNLLGRLPEIFQSVLFLHLKIISGLFTYLCNVSSPWSQFFVCGSFVILVHINFPETVFQKVL